ncbi:TBC1 domain family member 7-like isoform X1 [Rhipicephalus microplus]|uniref:TBC1 domain family member 7-like isoform X1 n=1 Tax=Rhipicephalus microplus TaxID=6941 RepID=UPI003F6C8A57
MAAAEMNFRAHYYDKVGFRGINENKSLEILLSEKPIDLKKLSNFCRKFCLPSVHRLTVWKVLLGILPTFEENITSFEKDEEDQYNDLRRALEVMRVVRNGTPQADTIVLLYLVGEGKLHLDIEQQMSDDEVQHIRSIASVFTKICSRPEEAYWMTRNFWKHLKKLAIDSDAMVMGQGDWRLDQGPARRGGAPADVLASGPAQCYSHGRRTYAVEQDFQRDLRSCGEQGIGMTPGWRRATLGLFATRVDSCGQRALQQRHACFFVNTCDSAWWTVGVEWVTSVVCESVNVRRLCS